MACGFEHVEIEKADIHTLFEYRDEIARRDELAIFIPAAERFCTCKPSGRDIDLRLVIRLEFAGRQGIRKKVPAGRDAKLDADLALYISAVQDAYRESDPEARQHFRDAGEKQS